VDVAKSAEFHGLAKSRAWNWQQGCMLQWLGAPAKDRVFYNDYRKDKYVGVIRSLDRRGAESVLERPLYALSPDGNTGVSVDFERLHRCMCGYGYSARRAAVDTYHLPDDDGIWIVNIQTGASRLVLSLKQIAKLSPRSSMFRAEHYLNHLEFSPTGRRLCFLHRWHARGKYYSRLYTVCPDGNGLRCLADNDLVSHHTWLDDEHLLAWSRQGDSRDRFYLYDLSATSSELRALGEGTLLQDGHPSFSPNRNFLLLDSYPDDNRLQSLLLFDLTTEELVELGKFRQPLRFNDDLRCDLHPRWNRGGTKICFDSTHQGCRQIYVADVDDWLPRLDRR
jgi:hypothetical protein